MKVIDLFSGIGGFSLAAHSLGWQTALFCECEPYATRVLRRHFPDVPVFDDVKELSADAVREAVADAASVRPSGDGALEGAAGSDGGRLLESSRGGSRLLLTAGFPCQDISYAGKGAGLEGARSGLFYEVARLVGEVRPDWVLLENVAGILTRGVDAVCGTMASLGYGFTYGCVRASDVGAPHRRDRWWLVAWPSLGDERDIERGRRIAESVLGRLTPWGSGESWPTVRAREGNGGECGSDGSRHYAARGYLDGVVQERVDGVWYTPNGIAIGSLNPDWVETLMGVPIGYTRPEGEPMLTLPGVWPNPYHDGDWRTPNATDGAHGGPNARDSSGRLHLTAQVAQTWPAGMGAPQHPWEPPRLTTEKEHRAARLRCLGNGIVPHVARLWMEAIEEEAWQVRHPAPEASVASPKPAKSSPSAATKSSTPSTASASATSSPSATVADTT